MDDDMGWMEGGSRARSPEPGARSPHGHDGRIGRVGSEGFEHPSVALSASAVSAGDVTMLQMELMGAAVSIWPNPSFLGCHNPNRTFCMYE